MRKPELVVLMLFMALIGRSTFAQNQHFKLESKNQQLITIDETFSRSTEIEPFKFKGKKIYGLAASADIEFVSASSWVRLILLDKNFNEHLILESYPSLHGAEKVALRDYAEETALLDGIVPYALKVEVNNASIALKSLSYESKGDVISDYQKQKKEKRVAQIKIKIDQLNKNLKSRGQHWVAGETSVSQLSYAERKQLYGSSTFPAGMEFYAGGVISTSIANDDNSYNLKSVSSSSPYINDWDWRNRHGKNWISPVTNQGSCGSCWAFASTGAVEAMVNVFFNQQINLDLSEQDVLSCSGAGGCSGGYPGIALDYIKNTGVVDENAFPYGAADLACSEKSGSPEQRIQIDGKVSFASSLYPRTEDDLKRMLIEKGPISGGLYDWSHAMVMVGYKVVQEGDVFYYRDLSLSRYWKTVEAGDPLIGKTVWIFKNSWGSYFGDDGYVYVETSIDNIGWTHAISSPISSSVQNYEVACVDLDGDGYYTWGLGEKPANCPNCPDLADGDDSDPSKGPLDEFGYCVSLTPAAPVAEFTSTSTTIDPGQSITFSDQSSNAPTSWSWTFEGGTPSTSTDQNPTVTYNATGTFNVSLTVSNSEGTDIITKTEYISVIEPVYAPVANFSANLTTINEGSEVSFTDLTTNEPTSWSWSFEGGTPSTSTAQNPKVVYSTPGLYDVTLSVTNEGGSNTKTETSYIQVIDTIEVPVADFEANITSVLEGDEIGFSDKSQNNPSSWEWVFEGGTPSTSTERNPKIIYNIASSYKVSLTITNAAGRDTKTIENYITVEAAPEPEYCIPSPNATDEWIAEVHMGDDSYISGSEGYADNTSTSFNLIAGSSNSFTLVPDFSRKSSFEYWGIWIDFNSDKIFSDDEKVFTSSKSKSSVSGTINIPQINITTRMRIAMGSMSPSACDLSQSGEVEDYTVVISEPAPLPPVAAFSAEPSDIIAGQTIQYHNLSENNPTSYQWYFPGGTPSESTEANPIVLYETSGTYDVSLIAYKTDFTPSELVMTSYITVSDNNSDPTPTPSIYCEPEMINSKRYYIKSVNIDNALTVNSYGDGYSFDTNPFTLNAGGTYSVDLVPSAATSRNFWRIWIDFNNDGDFDDADETVLALNNKKGLVTATIEIPSYATETARVRIAMKVGKSPAACDDNFEGEIEDYLVSFAPQTKSAIPQASSKLRPDVNLRVYPNPATNQLNLQLSGLAENANYAIYNLVGKKVLEQPINAPLTTIDMSDKAPGIYLVVVQTDIETFNEKVIKR